MLSMKGSENPMKTVASSLAAMALTLFGASSALAAPSADAVMGKRLFLRCAACHAMSAAASAKVGPHLQGVVGRKSGSVATYRYSAAMQKAALTWDEATLDRWLTRPATVVPGTSMAFAGVPNPAERKAIIAYLKKPVP
jgi:cytochrome c